MAIFGSGLILIDKTWEDLKNLIDIKNLILQFDVTPDGYQIFAVEGNVVYSTFIFKGILPASSDTTQEQNDLDKADFETFHQPNANQAIVETDGYGRNIVEARLIDDNGNTISFEEGSLPTHTKTIFPGESFNATNTPLGLNETFTGPGEDVSSFVNTDISILTDQFSAAKGLIFEWSQDNIEYNYAESFNVIPNEGQFFSLSHRAKFFRIRYINGAVAQTKFDLSAFHYSISRSTYVQALDTDIPTRKAVEVVKSVLAAQKEGAPANNSYTNLQATHDGKLRVALDTVVYPPISTSALVQKNNTGPSTDQNFSVPFISDVLAGNKLIAVVQQGQGSSGSTYTLSDSQGNVYTKNATATVTGVGSIDVWTAINATTGGCTISANNFNLVTTATIQIYEVSGVDGVDQLTATFNAAVTSISIGPVNTVRNKEFCISAFSSNSLTAITSGSGWSQDLSAQGFCCESQIQNTAGFLTGTATSGLSLNCLALIITFLPSPTSKSVIVDDIGKLLVKAQIQDSDGYYLIGQKVSSQSLPVVIASDQSSIPISGTVTADQGTPAAGVNAWPVRASDGYGSPIGTIKPDNAIRLQVENKHVTYPTFTIRASNIALANDKSLLSLVNGSGSSVKICIRSIWLVNVQSSSVTGVIAEMVLRRIDSHSDGTSVGIRPHDTIDIIDPNISAKFGATVINEDSTSLYRWRMSTDEFATGALDLEGHEHALQRLIPTWARHDPEEKPIVIRPGGGLTIKNITNTTAGTFDISIVFTQEDL
jgi:hypothetical protein